MLGLMLYAVEGGETNLRNLVGDGGRGYGKMGWDRWVSLSRRWVGTYPPGSKLR